MTEIIIQHSTPITVIVERQSDRPIDSIQQSIPVTVTAERQSSRLIDVHQSTPITVTVEHQSDRLIDSGIRGWFQPTQWLTSTGGGTQRNTTIPAAYPLSALRLVAVDDSEQLIYATSDNPEHAFRILGMTTVAVGQGQTATVLIDGEFSDPTWNWSLGVPIFAGPDGMLTQTAPIDGFLLQVATPISPTKINFEPQEPTVL